VEGGVPDEPQEPNGVGNRWKYATASATVVTVLGIAVYLTVTTGEPPYELLVPLVGGALWALYAYRISGGK
jgi:hypothetical protein